LIRRSCRIEQYRFRSRRKQLTMSKITAKVKNPSDQAAYLASFPNGAMTKRTLGDVSWTIRQGPSTKRASKRAKPTFLAGGSGKVNWNSPEDLCRRAGQNKYYVAVYNKKKGELEVFNAGETIFPMMQQVNSDKTLEDGIAHDSLSHMSSRESRAVLTHTFGSRMAQKGLKAIEMNVVTENNIVGVDEIEKHLTAHSAAREAAEEEASGGKSNAEIALERSRRDLLPAYHLDAETPEAAYPFTEMVTSKDSSCMKDLLKELEKAKTEEEQVALKESGQLFSQVIRRIANVHERLAGAGDKAERRMAFQKILFLSYLQRFYFFGRKIKADPDITALAERAKMPVMMMEKLLGLFASRSRRDPISEGSFGDSATKKGKVYVVGKAHQDKLICYLCISTLMVEGYRKYDPAYLARDLKLSVKQINVYFKHVGCKVEKVSRGADKRKNSRIPNIGQYRVSLRTPLTFPKPPRAAKK